MQLLRDNLTLWTSSDNGEPEAAAEAPKAEEKEEKAEAGEEKAPEEQ